MIHRSILRLISVTLIVASIAGGALFLMSFGPRDIAAASALIAGVAVMATIAHLSDIVHVVLSMKLGNVSFNAEFHLTAIREATEAQDDPIHVADEFTYRFPWELSSAQLIGRDNALALAKLRIDLERALRAIAIRHKLASPEAAFSAMRLVEMLTESEQIPGTLKAPIREVITVANKAVHGQLVDDQTTVEVVAVGSKLVQVLTYYAER